MRTQILRSFPSAFQYSISSDERPLEIMPAIRNDISITALIRAVTENPQKLDYWFEENMSNKDTKKRTNYEESNMSAAVLEDLKLMRSDLTSQMKKLSNDLKDFQRNRNERSWYFWITSRVLDSKVLFLKWRMLIAQEEIETKSWDIFSKPLQ